MQINRDEFQRLLLNFGNLRFRRSQSYLSKAGAFISKPVSIEWAGRATRPTMSPSPSASGPAAFAAAAAGTPASPSAAAPSTRCGRCMHGVVYALDCLFNVGDDSDDDDDAPVVPPKMDVEMSVSVSSTSGSVVRNPLSGAVAAGASDALGTPGTPNPSRRDIILIPATGPVPVPVQAGTAPERSSRIHSMRAMALQQSVGGSMRGSPSTLAVGINSGSGSPVPIVAPSPGPGHRSINSVGSTSALIPPSAATAGSQVLPGTPTEMDPLRSPPVPSESDSPGPTPVIRTQSSTSALLPVSNGNGASDADDTRSQSITAARISNALRNSGASASNGNIIPSLGSSSALVRPVPLPPPPPPAPSLWTRFSDLVSRITAAAIREAAIDAYGAAIPGSAVGPLRLPKGMPPGGWRWKGMRIMRSAAVTGFFDFIVLLNTVAVLAQVRRYGVPNPVNVNAVVAALSGE